MIGMCFFSINSIYDAKILLILTALVLKTFKKKAEPPLRAAPRLIKRSYICTVKLFKII